MSEGERKPVAFHPPLVAAFPVLAVYSANVGLFPLHELFRPYAVVFLGGLLLWLVTSALRRSFERGATIASIVGGAAWAIQPTLHEFELSNGAIGAVVAGLFVVGWVWSIQKRQPTKFLNVFAVLLTCIAAGTILLRGGAGSAAAVASHAGPKEQPDIFYLLLDGYGRQDQLERVLGYDNSPFIEELRKRGFYVADSAHSNYVQTALSLASILNLDFVQALLPNHPTNTSSRTELNDLVDRPRLVRELRASGYQTIAVATGFPGFTFSGFDLVLEEHPTLTYFEAVLLGFVPFRLGVGLADSQYEQRRRSLLGGFANLKGLATPTVKPRFVFAHVLAPHPPFVFLADGTPNPKRKNFGYWDGSDYMTHIGTPESYREGYVQQVQWLNGEILATVDALLAKGAKQPPIIVLQADHGSKLGLDQGRIEATDIREAFGTLSAYHVPQSIGSKLRADISPLETIRWIAEAATGASFPPVEPKSYYSPFDKPYAFTDVTDRLR